ncbi:MOSC domain-containing protein [Sphingomonas sp.]|uniref:MOSC domain-containing protein n=1 Tax=Sphingomonas sp. TaxID=28214 RepID=UPI00286B0949|nr:MOSC domain-containing protein [Sphingomonas sp.]
MTIRARLHSVQLGRIAPLGPQGVPSGFVKSRIDGPVAVTSLGLAGDETADLSVHGGPEKAVYAYSAAHYPAWAAEHPEHAALFIPGGVGENLTIDGWVEADLCVGDVHRIGTAHLQVCQPRQPCFKFALRFNDNRLPKAMVRSGRAGWYYRVIEEGILSAGDAVELVDRPNPGFCFDQLVTIVNARCATTDELAAMAAMEGLASKLRAWARSAA